MANDTMTAADVLGRFHEAEGRFFESGGADVPSFEGILHPDFVLVEPTDGPYGGEWRGREGLLGFLNAMNDDWSEQGPIEAPELIEQGDRVVALATIRAKSRETGRVVEFPLCQVALVRDGLLAETRVFYWDTKEMKTALGK
jgi:ketosteroid isomerase-like protein